MVFAREFPVVARARSITDCMARHALDMAPELSACELEVTDQLKSTLRNAIAALLCGLEADESNRGDIARDAVKCYSRYDPRVNSMLRLHDIVVLSTWRTIVAKSTSEEERLLPTLAERIIYYNHDFQSAVQEFCDEESDFAPGPIGQESVVRSLVYGIDCPEKVAERAHVRLSSAYVVLVFVREDLDELTNGERRRPSLPARLRKLLRRTDSGEPLCSEMNGNVLLFLPVSLGVTRREAMAVAREAYSALPWRQPRVAAVSPCPQRSDAAVAVNEALDVLSVVRSLEYPPGLYQLDDVLIESALFRAPDLSERLAQRLAPLEGMNEYFIRTLEAYLRHDLDRRKTARALHIHPNTLDYRLRRVREAIDLSPLEARDLWLIRGALASLRINRRRSGLATGEAQDQRTAAR